MNTPFSDDGINFMLQGCTLKILTIDERIKSGDFIRPLVESPMMSESGGWDTTYKNDKWRGPRWHLVDNDFRGWVGKTYRDYILFCDEQDRRHNGEEDDEYPNIFEEYSEHELVQDEIVRVLKCES